MDGFSLAMKTASKFLRVLPSFGAASKILHKKEWFSLSARCLAISDLLSAELCSDVLQHYEWLHQCKFLHNCIHLYKFCMADVYYNLLTEKVILLSSLIILQQYYICHLQNDGTSL